MNTTIQGIKPRKPKEMEEMTGYFVEYQNGNERNFKKLYNHLERKCMDYLKYNKKYINSSYYEDIISIAFVEAIKYKHTFDASKSQVTTWFYRIIDSVIYHNKHEAMENTTLMDNADMKRKFKNVCIDHNEEELVLHLDMDYEQIIKNFN